MIPWGWIAVAVVGVVALRAIAGGLRYRVYEADNGTWAFAVFRGQTLVFTGAPYANQIAATTAAAAWIAANPNAGKGA